jgi:hypothetical protein
MKYLRYILTTVVVTVLLGGYFYHLTFTGQIEQNPVSRAIISVARPYPELTEPKETTLSCDFHGENLVLTETLYGSLYDYYRTDPAKKSAYLHNREKDFVFSYEEDNTILGLTNKIKGLGSSKGLTNDQTLDLAACFMQGIPYDDAKAARILGDDFTSQPIDSVIPRYPYETLYDNLGICTDKTYLGAAVFGGLGYETAIMTFNDEKHMSLGIAVPAGYGSYGTRYGIMELTGSGFLVGDIPELNANAGLAINNFQTLPQIDEDVVTEQNKLTLSNPSGLIELGGGSPYIRIVERIAVRQKLEELRTQLDSLRVSYESAKTLLENAETELANAESVYNERKTQSNYNLYLKVYNQYLVAFNNFQTSLVQYNNVVDLYNKNVAAYQQF